MGKDLTMFIACTIGMLNCLCKFLNKILSHAYTPPAMLKGRIRPTVKSPSGTKTDSQNYRPVTNSSNFCWSGRAGSVNYAYRIYGNERKSFVP